MNAAAIRSRLTTVQSVLCSHLAIRYKEVLLVFHRLSHIPRGNIRSPNSVLHTQCKENLDSAYQYLPLVLYSYSTGFSTGQWKTSENCGHPYPIPCVVSRYHNLLLTALSIRAAEPLPKNDVIVTNARSPLLTLLRNLHVCRRDGAS